MIEDALHRLGLILPPPATPPPGFEFHFERVRIRGNRVFVAGHMAQAPDGALCGPFGKVPSQVPVSSAQEAARNTAMSILASLKLALGDLDRIEAWMVVQGFVNADPGFPQTTHVLDTFSDRMLEIFGPDVGAHSRTAIGVAALPSLRASDSHVSVNYSAAQRISRADRLRYDISAGVLLSNTQIHTPIIRTGLTLLPDFRI
jgi:enamine deaminase RidA (YjgF/YER057c/UK114 family)